MLTNYKQILEQFNKDLTEEIIKDPDFQKMKASGRSEAFLKNDDSFRIIDETQFIKYALNAFSQDKGRGPNKINSGGLIQGIYNWLLYRKKIFQYKNNKERLRLAFAIAIKIAKRGSSKFRLDRPQTSVFEDALNKQLPFLIDQIGNAEASSIFSIFDNINLK